MTTQNKYFREEIDNYKDTIFAIVGFMNFYLFDANKQKRDNVKVFQGWKFDPSDSSKASVTPDIGIVYKGKNGVIGEVKHSFPADKNLWMKNFEQLIKYDDDLSGWPTDNQKIANRDIILLTHQGRSRAVKNYYTENKDSTIRFNNPFVIVEYNRNDQANPFIFFRIEEGKLSFKEVNDILEEGKQVPMHIYVNLYSVLKLYDSEPPLPYMIELIWSNVVLRKAAETDTFRKLKKNQSIEIPLTLDEIVDELNKGFAINRLYNGQSDRLPQVPKKAWVRRACAKLVSIGEAKWKEDTTKEEIIVFFRKHDKVLEHFIEQCSEEAGAATQTKLFNEE